MQNCIYPAVSRVYTGAYAVCREIAAIIYPQIPALLASGVRDFDFGDFNGRSRDEMISSPEFEKWAKSTDIVPFPGGEPPYVTTALNIKEFSEIINDLEHSNADRAAVIIPKSVIFIILNRYLSWGNGYGGIMIAAGGGCVCAYDTGAGSMRLLKII